METRDFYIVTDILTVDISSDTSGLSFGSPDEIEPVVVEDIIKFTATGRAIGMRRLGTHKFKITVEEVMEND